jgi:hypothetical protein
MTTMTRMQEILSTQTQWDFAGLSSLYVNTTL